MKHKHHDLIVKWAADTSIEIEILNNDGGWVAVPDPAFVESAEYRIKPPEPKKIKFCAFEFSDGGLTWSREGSNSYEGRMVNMMRRIPELDKEVTLP